MTDSRFTEAISPVALATRIARSVIGNARPIQIDEVFGYTLSASDHELRQKFSSDDRRRFERVLIEELQEDGLAPVGELTGRSIQLRRNN